MKRMIAVAVLLGVVFLVGEAWAATTYRWSLVRVGGKDEANTYATGTNDAGWIVGNYIYLTGSPQQEGAFTLVKKEYQEFTLPDIEALEVAVVDVAKSTTIVGTYKVGTPESWELHAFLYRHSPQDHIVIDVPGAFWSFPTALNDKRQVAVGYYYTDEQGETRWATSIYDYATGAFTPVTVFGYTDVTVTGMNNKGEMVGVANTLDVDESCHCVHHYPFYRKGGKDILLTTPKALRVEPAGLNDNGLIVGSLNTGLGFVWNFKSGAFQEITPPMKDMPASEWTTRVVAVDSTGTNRVKISFPLVVSSLDLV
jgi:hypothetical protein